MAGAAAVAAAVLASAELGLPVGVTGYLCLAENMPSGTAQRPSDVVVIAKPGAHRLSYAQAATELERALELAPGR